MENETVEELAQCFIGLANNSMCHLKTFTIAQMSWNCLQALDWMNRNCCVDEWDWILTNIHKSVYTMTLHSWPNMSICKNHVAILLERKHIAQKKNLRSINLLAADQLKELTKNDVKPGQKMCASCRKEFAKSKKSADPVSSTEPDPV